LKRLWDEFDDMSEVPVCKFSFPCDALKKTRTTKANAFLNAA